MVFHAHNQCRACANSNIEGKMHTGHMLDICLNWLNLLKQRTHVQSRPWFGERKMNKGRVIPEQLTGREF